MQVYTAIVVLAFCATMTFAQTGEPFCQTGTVNTTGSNSICTGGAFNLCSQYPGVAQMQANIIANNMTSITLAGQVSKGNQACSYVNAAGTAAWTNAGNVCPSIPASTCTLGASCTVAPVPTATATTAGLPCCSDLRYFMKFWCQGPNMLNAETAIFPNSTQITLLSYLPGLGQVNNCQLCGAELPSTTTAAPTTTTAAATNSTTTAAPATTTAAATTTTAATTRATTLATTAATTAATTRPATSVTVAAAAVTSAATQALAATTAAIVNQPTQPQQQQPIATTASNGFIEPTATPSSATRSTLSVLAVALFPLIVAALF